MHHGDKHLLIVSFLPRLRLLLLLLKDGHARVANLTVFFLLLAPSCDELSRHRVDRHGVVLFGLSWGCRICTASTTSIDAAPPPVVNRLHLLAEEELLGGFLARTIRLIRYLAWSILRQVWIGLRLGHNH